jgi:hypothetical protein
LSFSNPDYDILISTLEAESQVLIDWFKDNKMQANPDKFYVSLVGWEPLHFQAKFQRRMNNHHIQIAELALEFFQVFLSFFQYKNAMQMKKKNEFCKVRQESKRNKRLFFVSTTRDIQ